MTYAPLDPSLWKRQLDKLTTGRHVIREPVDLSRRVEQIHHRFGHGHKELVNKDRINSAVGALSDKGIQALRPQDRYVLAYGLSQSLPVLKGEMLIQSEQLFDALLHRWRQDSREERLRGAVWRGLFRSFLQAPTGPPAAKLQRFLVESFESAKQRVRPGTSWLDAVERHIGLLHSSPCDEYITEIFHGGHEKLDDLVANLTPPPASWFWDALVDTLSQQIEQLPDATFKDRIDLILRIAQFTQLISRRDQILAGLLDRYASTRDRSRHQQLLDFSLEHWKSPQLKSSLKWSQARPGTQHMVCAWLALEDLEDFYRLCQAEKQVDDDRLRYWLRFKGQIGFSQIVLGSALFWSSDPDIREFRQRKKGRLAQLTAGQPENNAILMQIGDWLFVEFSSTGNACYPYKLAHLPFERGISAYAVSQLKDVQAVEKSRARRLRHRLQWQIDFDAALADWGIYPDGSRSMPARTIRSEPSALNDTNRKSPPRHVPWARDLPATILRALEEADAKVEDLRNRGGSLWIYPGRHSNELHQGLTRAGFKFKIGRGYHRQ